MRKCPYCGSKKWCHYRGGRACLRTQLLRILIAIADFRCSVYEDTYLTDETKDDVMEHLDFMLET